MRKLKSSFTLEWRSSRTCLLSLPLGFFFSFLRQRDKIPYPINSDIRDCWPVFQVANKEKTLGPRLLALHFPVVLWCKWSRQAHHLSLTNLLPAKTIKVKWLGFCGWKNETTNSHSPEIKDEAARRLKRAIFTSLIFFRRGGGWGGGNLRRKKRNSKQPSPQNQGWSRKKAKTHQFPMRGGGSKLSVNFVQDCSLREKSTRHAR